MKNHLIILLIVLFHSCSGTNETKKDNSKKEDPTGENREVLLSDTVYKVAFPSTDSILIQADIYKINDTAPVILLCHQARYNKTEYAEIAPKLNKLGFNCIAIDQRSGGLLNDSSNITNVRAVKAGKPVDYLDAEKDIIAAIDFTYERFGRNVILWGSSYSSTLALFITLKNEKVAAVVSFSPGDYFPELGSLTEMLADFSKPIFVTSSKEEAVELTKMLSKMKLNENQIHFIPESEGTHGSRALWNSDPNNAEYWEAITKFLNVVK